MAVTAGRYNRYPHHLVADEHGRYNRITVTTATPITWLQTTTPTMVAAKSGPQRKCTDACAASPSVTPACGGKDIP